VVLAASAFVVLAAEPSNLLIDTAVIGHLGTAQLGGLGIAVAVIGLLLVIGEFGVRHHKPGGAGVRCG